MNKAVGVLPVTRIPARILSIQNGADLEPPINTIATPRKLFHEDVLALQVSVREDAAVSLQRDRETPLKELGHPWPWLVRLSILPGPQAEGQVEIFFLGEWSVDLWFRCGPPEK